MFPNGFSGQFEIVTVEYGTVLNPVSSGEIEIVPGTSAVVRYKFSCLQLLVAVRYSSAC